MAMLPPVGWADVATKHDLEREIARLEQRFDLLDQRFDLVDQRCELSEQRVLATVRADLAGQTRTLLFAMIGVMFTFASAVLVAAVKV